MVVPETGEVLAKGLVERIGEDGSDVADHGAAMGVVTDQLAEAGVDLGRTGLRAVGHRVVHGGPDFSDPVLVDDAVVADIRDLVPLAPLHNPGALAGIEAARAAFDVPQVAVFDTAFFTSLPAAASTYAIPKDVRERHRVRRYGFHGTSHRYVSRAAAALLGRPLDSFTQVVLHLGNGCSASAIAGGVAVDTSMGLTPLQGLVMGTRSGDIDPAVFSFLHPQVGPGGRRDRRDAEQAVRPQGPGRGQRLPRGAGAGRRRGRGRRGSPSTSTCTGCVTTSAPTPPSSAGSTSSPSPPAWARTRRSCGPPGRRPSAGSGCRSTRGATRPRRARPASSPPTARPSPSWSCPTNEELEIARQAAALLDGRRA